ncbi:trypsin-like peptidase domain-containing protein [Streptomyces sp. NPDC050147]|uniref:trypsin-like peptidase domain-containing protein n=1 Tax=Streptomyces sp. NPDC050147 TaxID=3155513 RepID=UPI00341C704C
MDAIGRLVRDGVPVGTAFVVTADGLAATAAHVISPQAEADWAFVPLSLPGRSMQVEMSSLVDKASDAALVRIGGGVDWQPMALARMGVRRRAPLSTSGVVRAQSRDYDSGVGSYCRDELTTPVLPTGRHDVQPMADDASPIHNRPSVPRLMSDASARDEMASSLVHGLKREGRLTRGAWARSRRLFILAGTAIGTDYLITVVGRQLPGGLMEALRAARRAGRVGR